MASPKTDPDLFCTTTQIDNGTCSLVVRSFGLSDQGRVRDRNEDCFLIAELARSLRVHQANFGQPGMQYSDCRGHMFMVADGMGGHAGGEIASALSVETVETFLLNTLRHFCSMQSTDEQSVLQEFQRAIVQADARLIQEARHHPELYGMGTTLTIAFIDRTKLFVAHVGDSRCYLLAQGELQQVTNDHNMAAEMVRRGMLTPEAAMRSRMRHVITNVLGGNAPGVNVELHRVELEPGDILLLCSDGLTGMVPDETIQRILKEEQDPDDACQRLISEANAAGGKDNITAVVARFDSAA